MPLSKKSSTASRPSSLVAIPTIAALFGRPRETGGLIGSLGVGAEPSLYPEGRFVLYQVLIRNATSQPIFNTRVMPRVVEGNLMVRNAPKIIPKLNANSSGTATFRLEPTGEVESVEVECFLTFSRDGKNSPLQLLLSPISYNFTLPELMHVKVSQEQWKEKISRYFSDEESYNISTLPVEQSLITASGVLVDLGLAYFTRFKSENGYAMERQDYFAMDSRGRGYGARILCRFPHVKGTHATMRIRLFAETEEGLFALCHRVFKRLEVKFSPRR